MLFPSCFAKINLKGGGVMKYDELVQLATNTSREVVEKNKEIINEEIKNFFSSNENGATLSLYDALSKAMVLSLVLVPEISAVVTAKMLVQLGLVEVEDAE